jgi:conjugal transfer pilus assembly protein TraW
MVDADDRMVARVEGLGSSEWLRSAVVRDGKRGDLGSFGTPLAISEQDMAEVIRARLASADLRGAGERAKTRYWDSLGYTDLPVARADRSRLLDPTFEVTETITTPDGGVVASQGDRVNPLDIYPFPDAIVVLDATDAKQVALVQAILPAYADRPVTLISTRFDRDAGWQWLFDTSNRLGLPVHLLQPDVQSRFAIERVPSVVTAEGRYFKIDEFAVVEPTEVSDEQ